MGTIEKQPLPARNGRAEGDVGTEADGSVANAGVVAGAGNGRAKRDVGAETRGAVTRARVVSEADVKTIGGTATVYRARGSDTVEIGARAVEIKATPEKYSSQHEQRGRRRDRRL